MHKAIPQPTSSRLLLQEEQIFILALGTHTKRSSLTKQELVDLVLSLYPWGAGGRPQRVPVKLMKIVYRENRNERNR